MPRGNPKGNPQYLNKGGINALRIVRKYFPKVEAVQDATRHIYVQVTTEDSQTAARMDHEGCALAVACRRHESADGIIVSIKTAYVVKGQIAYRYKLPESTSREIVSFDRRGGFEAGVYELAAPSPAQRLGVRQSKHDRHRGGGQSRPHHFTTNIRAIIGRE